MSKMINLVGKRFGRLVVTKLLDERGEKDGQCRWECKCDCGETCIVKTVQLNLGKTKSCGCWKRESAAINGRKNKQKDRESVLARRLYSDLKKRNRKKFASEEPISYEEFLLLIKSNCYYCGAEPSQEAKDRHGDYILKHNGIDRIDSSKGYVEGNVRPCCATCNCAKGTMTEEEFYKWLKRFYSLQKSRGNV